MTSQPTPGKPNAFVVLGMHKSGTTLVSECLHKAGIPMEEGIAEPKGYEHGYTLERRAAQAVNKRYLDCGDDVSQDILLSREPVDPATHAECVTQAATLIDGLSAQGQAWGFKDPRTLLVMPVWEQAFERARIRPTLIGVYRNPVEVFGHYKRLLKRKWLHRDPRYLMRVLQSWSVHNRALLDVAARSPDLVLFEFTALMTQDTEIRRLHELIGTSGPDARKSDLYRARPGADRDYRIARALARLSGSEDPERLLTELNARRAGQIGQTDRNAAT